MIADRSSHHTDGPLLMSLPAPRTGDLFRVRAFIRRAAGALRIEPSIIEDLVQAVDESVTNVIVHGYSGRTGPIEIAVAKGEDQLVVKITDEAPCFDPNGYVPADLTKPLNARPLHGMGIHLTRACVDRIDHRPEERVGNELTLVKDLSGRKDLAGRRGQAP